MRKKILLAAMVGVTCAFATSAHAVTVTFDATNTSNIPGLTGFMTLGDMMDGLEVTVTFASGGSETRSWADTGFQSGGVAGTGWSLNLTGDTFVEDWEFSSTEFVTGITLNGLNAFTVFDIEPADNPGAADTPGSAAGRTWECLTGACDVAFVNYRFQVAVGGNPAQGDLWQVVEIDLRSANDGRGIRDFTFGQDTDNDARLNPIPEPGTLLLIGSGVAALARRRRKA